MSVRAQDWAQTKAVALALLLRAAGDWDESLHPRDEQGQFASGGGGDGGSASSGSSREETVARGRIDPEVTQVGGGAWNKGTALRLEIQYQAARPRLDALVSDDMAPKKYDPLNNEGGGNAAQTQALAHYLSVQRSEDIIKQRNLGEPSNAVLVRAHTQLWGAWGKSSTTRDGRLLQLAVAEELGGRLNEQTGRSGLHPIEPENLKGYADRRFKELGGYEGVKAYVRAKWEVTQYLLDRAGIKELELYRAVNIPRERTEGIAREPEGKYTKLPGLKVVRNGAASTTTDIKVANTWGKSETRVVLRALVPRTAAVSVPAYGVLPEDLREVVVAGTAWKAWDAWEGEAPGFKERPMDWAA